MSITIILGKVRDQIPLQKEEINEFSAGLADGSVSDAQGPLLQWQFVYMD